MRRAAIILAALAMTGCASGNVVWNRAGATEQNFNEDKYLCARDAIALGGTAYVGFGITERTINPSVFGACMVARGWTASQS